MEDAATAEISRSQVWQWIHNDVTLESGDRVTRDLVAASSRTRSAGLREARRCRELRHRPDVGHGAPALRDSALGDEFPDFLTLPAYEAVLAAEGRDLPSSADAGPDGVSP